MDPERLKRLREKLRDGQPAQVVNGQVTLAGDRPAPRGPRQGAEPAGVQVKQHEWGRHAD